MRLDGDSAAPVPPRDASDGEAHEPLEWSVRSQIMFVAVAMPVVLFLVVVAPYLLSHYVINRHDRFNYIPPPLGGDRALEGHWTDPPVASARMIKIEDARLSYGWVAPNGELVTKVFPTASGTIEQVFVAVGQAVAKDAPIFSIRPRESSGNSAVPPQTAKDPTVVLSPIGGTVTQISVAPGDPITVEKARTEPAALVADLATVWVEADVEPAVARTLKEGEAVEVHSTALAGRSFEGHVLSLSPFDPATGRVPVRILVANPDGALKPDMLAEFAAPGGAEALVVPQSAVLFENDGPRVFVMEHESDAPGASKKLVARSIHVGRFGDGWVEAVEGLKPGEQVEATDAVFIDRAAKGY
jgi:multidrug efflux pump subunit AcrA (membrane-fusion protein)